MTEYHYDRTRKSYYVTSLGGAVLFAGAGIQAISRRSATPRDLVAGTITLLCAAALIAVAVRARTSASVHLEATTLTYRSLMRTESHDRSDLRTAVLETQLRGRREWTELHLYTNDSRMLRLPEFARPAVSRRQRFGRSSTASAGGQGQEDGQLAGCVSGIRGWLHDKDAVGQGTGTTS